MSAACENMLLEAVNLGLGGLWNGVAPTEETMAKVAELFDLDNETHVPFSIVTIGYPAE